MTRVFNRMTAKLPPVAVRAEGLHIWDSTGKSYIDACGGAAVSCLGHGHPKVMEAMDRQVRKLDYVHPGFFSAEPAEHLADLLMEDAPAGISHVYFVSGGSEAMEAALKMARQYFLEIGQPKRSKFISRRQSYHGNTLGALSVGGNLARREPYAPMLMDVSLIAPCFAYHFKRDDETEEQYGLRVANELEADGHCHHAGAGDRQGHHGGSSGRREGGDDRRRSGQHDEGGGAGRLMGMAMLASRPVACSHGSSGGGWAGGQLWWPGR